MKIVINFYLLILALSILIYFISQRRVNTKGFATKSKYDLCNIGFYFKQTKFLKQFDFKKLNFYVFVI